MKNLIQTDRKVTLGCYIALAFAVVFSLACCNQTNGTESLISQR